MALDETLRIEQSARIKNDKAHIIINLTYNITGLYKLKF